MTDYWDKEKSLTEGKPYELHEFRLGATSTYWRYADAPQDITYLGNVFTRAWMPGDPIEDGPNLLKNRTVVKADWRNPFVWQYTIMEPNEVVNYRRYSGHGSDVKLIFVGEVSFVVFKQKSRQGDRHAEINIDPPRTQLRNAMGLVARYSRQCTVEIYSDQCGVDRDSFNETGTLDSVSGNVLTDTVFGGHSDGYWPGGDIIINSYRRAKIVAHSGNSITILPFIYGVAAGDSFDAAPGCNHQDDCNDRFSNLANKKAQPNIPDENPWSSEALLG